MAVLKGTPDTTTGLTDTVQSAFPGMLLAMATNDRDICTHDLGQRGALIIWDVGIKASIDSTQAAN